jgi:hypothetical protein
VLLLKVADVRHAVSRVVNACARGILDLPDEAQPRFVVAARVERLPGGVSPVLIFVCAVYRRIS